MSWHIHNDYNFFDSDGYGSDDDERCEPETNEDFEYELDRDDKYIESLERRFD